MNLLWDTLLRQTRTASSPKVMLSMGEWERRFSRGGPSSWPVGQSSTVNWWAPLGLIAWLFSRWFDQHPVSAFGDDSVRPERPAVCRPGAGPPRSLAFNIWKGVITKRIALDAFIYSRQLFVEKRLTWNIRFC
jgi:hypothetical protein